MNKEVFLTMSPDKRVEEINKMLQSLPLKEVAVRTGIAYSTFLKEMTAGDYVYIQRDNRYYKFLRDEDASLKSKEESIGVYHEELLFLRENIDVLKQLVNCNANPPLLLD
ncbi:hypothetical protein [Paenibacillus sp. FSL L8-0499]|uniref:hypothetical protein n=1 Tax=Paenibacillus sp. FSL L8-0499 TaxID=2975334 RepID=UPI0030F80126